MRDPNTMNKPLEYNTEDIVLKIDNLPAYDIPDWDFQDEKDMKKYFIAVERLVRNSYEYRTMVRYMRENLNMNKCSFYQNVSNVNLNKVKIHIHHDPFDLYNICLIVFNKRCQLNEDISEEMVAKEVMYLHYSMMVGLIPLAETVHELVHNKYLFVPTSKVVGRYQEFVNLYRPYMLSEQIDTLEMIEEASKTADEDYKFLLGRHYIYLDMTGSYELPNYEEIMLLTRNRIDVLKANPGKHGELLIQPVTFKDRPTT